MVLPFAFLLLPYKINKHILRGRSMKKAIMLVVLGVLLIYFSGCNTTGGARKDVDKVWKKAEKTDVWLRKNAW